jgi:hypothetical protein
MALSVGANAPQALAQTDAKQPYFAPASHYQKVEAKKFVRLTTQNLKFDNDGVVETALAYAAYMRIAAPEADLSDLLPTIEALTMNGTTNAIRVRASITRGIFANPRAFTTLLQTPFETSEEFFYAATVRLASTYFAEE